MITPQTFEHEEIGISVLTDGLNIMKASLFNLIVVSNTLQRALNCQEITKIVTEKYPCRVIFVQADEASPVDFFHMERTVQAIGTGTTRVCFDQITIDTSPAQLKKVPFLVLPNIMPDLPIYLFLSYDPTQDQLILPELQKYANRVIYDIESVDSLQRFSEQILGQIHHAPCEFIDSNWARTKGWREIMARAFQEQEKLALLNQSKMIQISFSEPSRTHTKSELQAIYLQAWLAAQLNWTLTSVDRESGFLRVSYHSKESPITISCLPKDTEAQEPGAIFSIEVMTHNESHFLLSCEGSSSQVTVHASDLERCEMPYTLFLQNYQKGPPLVQEIFYQAPSEHYINMLKALNHPAWK
jgi:glucose-6-phosphate dehydrogenase assembly protein OpcA